MNWRNVRLIASREIQDQFRDRRTLFMVLVLPLVLYPALAIGMLHMQTFFLEQTRTVVVLGAEHLPDEPGYQLIDGNRFVAGWFTSPLDVGKLRVVSDRPADEGAGEVAADKLRDDARLIVAAKEIRKKVERRAEIKRELGLPVDGPNTPSEPTGDDPRSAELVEELALLNKDLGRLFGESDFEVLIVVPDGFDEHLVAVNDRLESRDLWGRVLRLGHLVGRPWEAMRDAAPGASPMSVLVTELAGARRFVRQVWTGLHAPRSETGAAIAVVDPSPRVIRNSADESSRIAYGRVREALGEWKDSIVRDRLTRAHLPKSITDVDTETVEVAGNEAFTANIWGKLFPALLVIMCVTGAFHPAVDLAAGEKERGTMETLLICPASRTEIVIGKFLTIMLFSVTTAMLNLVSMGITAAYIISTKVASGGESAASSFGNLGFPGVDAILWVVLLSIPLAALFSALCLSLSTFARSVKEGQYYLTPLLMVTLGLTMFCMSPGAEIRPYTAVMPVVGPALLLKELLVTSGGGSALVYVLPVLLASVGYSALALWWAIDQFQREDVLFREAERFELKLWWRHLMREKEPIPSFAEAGICFALVVFLMHAAIPFFQRFLLMSPDGLALRSLQLLMIQQLVVVATPALIMGVMLTTDPLRTFRVRWPDLRFVGVAVLLAILLRPLAFAMLHWLGGWFFEPMSEAMKEQFALYTDATLPLWLVLLAMAVLPGICEEIAFRGFVLSGFNHGKRGWLAIGMSSLAFGVVHGLNQQSFHAVLIGVVLGLIALRSGSLLPCILFHIVSNAVTVLIGEAHAQRVTIPGFEYLIDRGTGEDLVFHWPVLVVSAIVSAALIRWLILQPNAREPRNEVTTSGSRVDEVPTINREAASMGPT